MASRPVAPHAGLPGTHTFMPAEHKVLNSWKEIGNFLGVTVRTVQRWERAEALPVHRHSPGPKAHVWAYEDELLAWRDGGRGVNLWRRNQDERAAALPSSASRRLALLAGLALLAALATLLLAWWHRIFPFHRTPASWQIANGRLTVFDPLGRVCWHSLHPGIRPNPPEIHDLVRIEDIDGDGRIEVLLSFASDPHAALPGELFCFEEHGALRWRVRAGAAVRFSGRDFDHNYSGVFTRPLDLRGRRLLLTVANHQIWYPAHVALRDPSTGRVLAEYWHPGAISHLVTADLDGDHIPELLLGGLNNPGPGLGHAALAVLPLPFGLPNSNPRRPRSPGGGEKAYLLFPRADVNDVTGTLPLLSRLSVDPSGRVLVIITLPQAAAASFTLDSHLHVIDHRFSDNFPAVHKSLEVSGLLRHPLSVSELARLRRVARFPAAPDANSPEIESLWAR